MTQAPKSRVVNSALALGSVLRDRRRERGLSQKQLAERTGITQPTISNVERGASRTSIDTVLRLAAKLDLELLIGPRPEIDLPGVWGQKTRG
jgi:transcriptional regulator with XRE-family HTH domain